VIAYVAKKFPDKKTFIEVLPDRKDGRAFGELHEMIAKNLGLTPLGNLYYAPDATDLSAIGTKIKQLNPGLLSAHGGGPQSDSMAFKAAYAAGYRGQLLGPATIPGGTMIAIAGADAIEGLISIGWPAEFDPATTEYARKWKADYIAKFGKWDFPEL